MLEFIRDAYKNFYHSKYNPEITLENTIGKEYASRIKRKSWFREKLPDTVSNVGNSFVIGTGIDSLAANLDVNEWMISRGWNTAINFATGHYYGKYRNWIYRIAKAAPESSGWKRIAADLFAFNTFQTPQYGIGLALLTLVREGGVGWEKVGNGMLGIAAISPLIGPTLGWTYDKLSEYCGFKTAAEQAGDNDVMS